MTTPLPSGTRRAARLALGLLLATTFVRLAADGPKWIEDSNRNTQLLLDVTGKFGPEGATQLGLAQFDEQVADLGPNVNERQRAALVAVRDELALGRKFDRHAFNAFLTGQGLLPPDLLEKAVKETFIPAQLKK